MSQWSGGWGFEPYVERLVENAVPPYLLGFEWASMNPFVAKTTDSSTSGFEPSLTHGTSTEDSSEDKIVHDQNCWGRLGDELSKYISDQKEMNNLPSDLDLQSIARKIIFDDDDPWNQTAADNQLWLGTLKFQNGIGPAPAAMEPQRPEEVPLMAPYAVRGGLKNKASNGPKPKVPMSYESFVPQPAIVQPSENYDPMMDFDFEQHFEQLGFDQPDVGMNEPNAFDMIMPLEDSVPISGSLYQQQLMGIQEPWDTFDVTQMQGMNNGGMQSTG